MAGQRLAQQRIGAEVFSNHRRIGAEIEHATYAFDDEQQGARIREANFQPERRAGLGPGHVDGTVRAINGDRSPIPRLLDRFDAWRGPRLQECQDRRPVIRRTIGEAEAVALRIGDDALSRQPPQLGRRAGVGAADLTVEAAHAAEPRRERHLAERESRFVEELLGEMDAARVRDFDRRRAEMLEEEAAQVARGHAKPSGQRIDAVLVQRAFADQPQRAGDDRGRADPRRRAR